MKYSQAVLLVEERWQPGGTGAQAGIALCSLRSQFPH
jgi:hypothetical protein